jgi:hypothetical protein
MAEPEQKTEYATKYWLNQGMNYKLQHTKYTSLIAKPKYTEMCCNRFETHHTTEGIRINAKE